MFSPKKKKKNVLTGEKPISPKKSGAMALSERPLTIGCCKPPNATTPHSDKMRNQTGDPPRHSSPFAETNYEGQGVSATQRFPPKRQNAGSWGSPLIPSPSHLAGQRRNSSQSTTIGDLEDMGVSVIDKEDLLDTIFISCDAEGRGRVAVSRVVQHIQMIVDSNESTDIDELALQLDPTGLDLEIDLKTYQNGIAQWIKNVQSKRRLEVSGAMEERPNSSNMTIASIGTNDLAPHWKSRSLDIGAGPPRNVSTPLSEIRPQWRTRNSEPSHLFSGLLDSSLDLSASYGSLEAQGGESTQDMADLQNRIEDLQFQIRKLSEHNMKLQVQIETTDDTNEQLLSQIDTLKVELKNLQQAWHRSQSIRDENEELKAGSKEWQKQHAQLEKDKRIVDEKLASLQAETDMKQALDSKLQAVQEKLSISLAEAESMQEEHRRLQTLLQEHKDQNEATEAHLEVKSTELAEKVKRCEEMQTNLEELYNLNRVLKSEKTQLEVRLSEVRQEFDSYQTQHLITPHEAESMSPTSTRTESGLGRSLHSELKSIVSADGNLPSPICGNENFDFENHLDDDSTQPPSNTLSRQSSQASIQSMSSEADQLLMHFRQRKDDIMKQLQQFLVEDGEVKAETENNEESRKVAFTQLLDQELDVMVDKLTSLAQTKTQLEHRANEFSFTVQSLKDDYARINKKYKEVLRLNKELTSTKSEVEQLRADNEMLEFDVKRGQQKTEELEKNLSLCQQDLETAHTAQQKYRQLAETQLGELRRLFKEMEKKYKISQDNARKQEATYKARLTGQSATHQTQLKSLLNLVTAECHRASHQTPLPLTVTATQETTGTNGPLDGSQVIDSVSSYLTELKTQLATSRNRVFSLKQENFCLEHDSVKLKRTKEQDIQSRSSLNWKAKKTGCVSGSCSVLIDALSLEIVHIYSKHSSHLFPHHDPSAHFPRQQSQDDSLLSILKDNLPSTALDNLHYRLLQESVTKKSQHKSHTISTQTEILRTPDREIRPYARSSFAQTGITSDPQEGRESGTQTEPDSVDDFKSSTYRLSNGANVKQAYLVSKPPSLNSAVLLPFEEATLSLVDSGSDLSDSFVTAYSSPVSSSPLRSSLRGSLEKDEFADFLGSPIITRNSSLEGPHPSPVDQDLRNCRESRSRSLILTPDIKLTSLHKKSAQDRQDAAQRMADLLATSYARPNIIVEGCQADSEDNDVNANYDRSGKYGSATPRKLSPARLKRRSHSDKEKDKRTVSSGSESKTLDHLLINKLPDVDMTEEEKEISQRLLEVSKKASERHKNRRGRKWSPSTSPDQRSLSPSDRSRSPSPCQTPPTADQPSLSSSAASTPEKPAETSQGVTEPGADGLTEETPDTMGELQEERTGAEGESDKEDNKLTTKSERKDSEVEVFDIKADILKADILKATGSLQAEMPQIKPLAKLREEHKLQRKTNIQFIMPELTEATESDPTSRSDNNAHTPTHTLASPNTTPVPGSPGPEVLHNSRGDSTIKGRGEGSRDQEERSSEEKSSLIPDSVLTKLGLKGGQTKDTNAMTDIEIEETFNSLQLAFKGNQYTLQNRLTLQHRQRDLAEKNIDREIEGLMLTLQMLEPLASVDTVSRDYINRIRQHTEVLQTSSLRLSSKAEGFGAVQQEGRLSKATDVMISHVENLKRLFEREHAELEDARKLLQENRKLFRGNSITNNLSIDGDTDSKLFSRRALSMSAGNSKHPYGYRPQTCSLPNEKRRRTTSCIISPRFSLPNAPVLKINESNQAGRRRASVATVVGSGLLSSSFGGQPFSFGGQHCRSQTEPSGISLGQGSRLAGAVRRTSVQLSTSLNTEDFKDAKARLTGSLSTGTINRHSSLTRTDSSIVVRRRSSDSSPTEVNGLDTPTSATPSPSSPLPSPGARDAVSLPGTPMVQSMPKVIDPELIKRGLARVETGEAKGSKNEDEAFRQGYEQGIRSKVTHELADLRDQQKVFCDSLEELIDQAEEEQEEDEEAEKIESNRTGIISRFHQLGRRWPRATRITRLVLTTFIFLFALVYVFLMVVPLEACLGSGPIAYSPWRTLKEVLWPYTQLRHHNPPPR